MIAILASSSINLLPDKTVLPQFLVYLMVFLVLNAYVIQPCLLVLRRRHELTKVSEAESAAKQVQVAQLNADIEAALKLERQKILINEEEKRKKTEAEARRLVEDARKTSQSFIESERSKLKTEALRVEAELQKQIPTLQQDIVTRVVSFEGAGS